MSYCRFDVILMLFPFTERKGNKQRPAVVLSHNEFNAAHQHSVVAMVTTASATRWPSDIPIGNHSEAGLLSPCVARAKFFTIADDVVIGRVGALTPKDAGRIEAWVANLVTDSGQLLQK